jgi:hypothetical protein
MSRFLDIYFCISEIISTGSKQTVKGKDQPRTGHEGPEGE